MSRPAKVARGCHRVGIVHLDDPYDAQRPGWYLVNTELGTRIAGPFPSLTAAEQRLRLVAS